MSDVCSDSGSSISVNSAILSGALTGVAGPQGPPGCAQLSCATTIYTPTPGRFYLGYFPKETVLDEVMVLNQGGTATITYNIKHGANYTGIGTDLYAASRTDTSSTTGTVTTEADFVTGANTILAGSHLWMDINTTLADSVIVAIVYTPECDPVTVTGTADGLGVPLEDTGTGTGVLPLTAP